MRVGSDVSSWFKQTVRVRQGCILSPDLFNLFLEHIVNEALQVCEGGARINGCCVDLQTLRFADDRSDGRKHSRRSRHPQFIQSIPGTIPMG